MSHRPPGSIGEYFVSHLAARPEQTAFWQSSNGALDPISWSDVAATVASVLQQISALGVDPGAHIATWLPNGLAWVAVDLAAQLRGFVHVALDARLSRNSVEKLVEHAAAAVLFTTAEQVHQLEQRAANVGRLSAIMPLRVLVPDLGVDGQSRGGVPIALEVLKPPEPDSLAQILFTSGTMNDPKGVMLSHRNLLTNALAKLDAAPQRVDDVRLNILPFAHAYARTCELSTWIIGGSQLCVARDWSDFLELAALLRPTLVNLVPHLANKLVAQLDRATEAFSSPDSHERLLGGRLRLLQVGGAALSLEHWNRLADAGWPPLQGYGLTESSPVICSNRAGQQRAGTVGPPVQGVELRLDEHTVLWTRGPHVMLGYWNSPAATAAKIVDGWLCTNDLAQPTEDGHWRILGRADDQISLSTGYKASPHELTPVLAHDAWVDQLVIVGQDRPYLAALVHPRISAMPAGMFAAPGMDAGDQQTSRDLRLLDEERFERALVARWSAHQTELPRQLRIERVGLLREPLTSDNGGLNFKGAIRRKFVERVLAGDQVAALYSAK